MKIYEHSVDAIKEQKRRSNHSQANIKANWASVVVLLLLAARASADPVYPLKLLPGSHYLVDQNDNPFFIQGDSPWFLVESLNASDVDYYLSNRWVQGYNSIILDLTAQRKDDGQSYEGNIYGQLPFTNIIAGPYTDLRSWNVSYFTNVDAVIQRAGYYGINVFAYPLYDGYNGSTWYAEMLGNSSNSIWSYGYFIGNRYKNFTNLVWLGAGDYSEPNAPNSCLWNIVAAGIRAADSNHLISAQAARPTPASYYGAFITLNCTYGSQFPYIESLANYEFSPVTPSFAREPYYEYRNITGTPYTALDCRNFAYWAVFSGDMGHFFGDEHQWPFGSGWQTEMWDSAATTITNVIKLMNTRPWWSCVPDSAHTTITSGYGTFGAGDYVASTREASGKTVMAYIPQGTITLAVNMTKISGSTANAWWYNPRTRAATTIGNYNTTGTLTFTTPDANDWVLVLDDASQPWGPPGSLSAVAPAISSFVASPATITSGGSSTLSWSVSGNPVPTLSLDHGIGTVTGSSRVVSPANTTTYTLTAANSAGSISAQVVVTVTAPVDTTPPSVPANLAVTFISTNLVNLSWTASTDNVAVAGYKIFRNGSSVGTSTSSSYSDTGLSPATTYTYTVSAFDAAGNVSGPSSAASATTQALTSTPALVQTAASIDDSTGTTLAQAFFQANTASNLIAVATSWGSHEATPTVSDSAGNTYVLATSTYSSLGDQSLAIYYAKNIKAGANVVTVNFGGSHAWRRILIAEYRGIDPVNPVDGVMANQAAASTATDNATSGTVTTTASGDLIFGAIENYYANGTLSAGTGFTLRNFLTFGGEIETAIEDKVQSSAGSTTATFTLAYAASYIAQMVAFRARTTTGDVTPPSVPQNLSASAATTSQVNLSWTGSTDNVGVAGYQIFRNGSSVGTSTSTSYSDTGLSPATTYTYTVSAFDAAGNVSAQSSSVSATTQAAAVAPAISSFVASPATITSGGSSTLSWSVSGNPVPTLSLDHGIGTVTGSSRVVSPANTTTYTLTAANSAGSISAQVVVTVTAPVDTTPPSVPANLAVTFISTNLVNLSWTASTDNVAVAGYKIFRNGSSVGTSTSTSYSDTGLSPATTYTYTVSAFDAAGNVSAQSSSVSATTQAAAVAPAISSFVASPATITSGGSSTLSWSVSGNPVPTLSLDHGIGTVTGSSRVVSPANTTTYTLTAANSAGSISAQVVVTVTAPVDTTPPSVPANLAVTFISTNLVNLSWTASTDNVAVAGYKIFRNGSSVGTSTSSSYSDTGLSPATTYTYTVSAFDAAGNVSGPSSAASATTQALTSTPALVQTAASIDDSTGTTLAQAFFQANTASNLIAVATSWGSHEATPTVSDSAGNTYVLATSTYSSLGDQSLAIYYAKNIKAGANVVTVNFGGSHAWRRILIAEYRGIDPVNPVDGVMANQAAASTATDNATSGTVTTTASGDLIFGAIENYYANGTLSAGTGFTLRNFLTFGGEIETAIEDKVQSSAGSTTATFTLAYAASYIAQMVAFRAATGP